VQFVLRNYSRSRAQIRFFRYPQLGFTKKIMDRVQQRPGVMQKFTDTLQKQREAKLKAKRGNIIITAGERAQPRC
jgi:hypothetical protein